MRIRKEATRRTWRNSTNSSNLPSLASCPANRVKYLSLLFLFDCSDSLTPVSCNALNCTNTGSVPRGLREGRPSRPETAALDSGFNKLATSDDDDADDDGEEGEEGEEEEEHGNRPNLFGIASRDPPPPRRRQRIQQNCCSLTGQQETSDRMGIVSRSRIDSRLLQRTSTNAKEWSRAFQIS